jgi:septal ring factor EnvC (AmiA/AmiB activator)
MIMGSLISRASLIATAILSFSACAMADDGPQPTSPLSSQAQLPAADQALLERARKELLLNQQTQTRTGLSESQKRELKGRAEELKKEIARLETQRATAQQLPVVRTAEA